MKINLEMGTDHDAVLLSLNGELKAEIVCGDVATEAALEARVEAAHRLGVLRRALLALRDLEDEDLVCHKVAKPEAARADLGRGFMAGLAEALVQHPGNHELPSLPAEHTKAYRSGHELGLLCSAALREPG